ncbi:GMC family oxidoreductase [Candidatus Protochlamydia phocaeensis]|uniref:GMC family oxidoreductase n=1 Tax=Candidatus Protochlamydia phocaeensis TaxID=1414722 RepID=UPI0008399CCC|nr:GMC family oxidoreductase [Candidatus Protochlamydia phocaeensis]
MGGVSGESLYEIKFYLEQLPNAESRLFLSEEYDELGMPLPCLDWKFREEDYLGFKKFIQKIKELLARHQLGRLEIEEECYNLDFIRDASHQMGTTRMAANPADGVVDINCKVFGINNLYLMGSSVFPSGGNANPTFTILALARRLASHLKRSFLS